MTGREGVGKTRGVGGGGGPRGVAPREQREKPRWQCFFQQGEVCSILQTCTAPGKGLDPSFLKALVH